MSVVNGEPEPWGRTLIIADAAAHYQLQKK